MRVGWGLLIFLCARPTRAFQGRALREHRRSSGSIPSIARPCTVIVDVLSKTPKDLAWVVIGEERSGLFQALEVNLTREVSSE